MANAYGDTGGRSGPYWRRQMGTTLPGERTGAQLHILNMARARLGLPPLGGPRQAFPQGSVGRQQLPAGAIDRRRGAFPVAPQPDPDLGRVAIPQGEHPRPDMPMPAHGIDGPAFGGGPTHIPPLGGGGLVPLPEPVFGKPSIGQNGHADLRARLLAQFQGGLQEQAPDMRDALRQYVSQHQQRRAIPGQGRQPILPRRQPRRAIPY